MHVPLDLSPPGLLPPHVQLPEQPVISKLSRAQAGPVMPPGRSVVQHPR